MRGSAAYPYYWRVKTRLVERFGQALRVLVRGKMNSCLVEFEDEYKVVTSRNYVRRREMDEKNKKVDIVRGEIWQCIPCGFLIPAVELFNSKLGWECPRCKNRDGFRVYRKGEEAEDDRKEWIDIPGGEVLVICHHTVPWYRDGELKDRLLRKCTFRSQVEALGYGNRVMERYRLYLKKAIEMGMPALPMGLPAPRWEGDPLTKV